MIKFLLIIILIIYLLYRVWGFFGTLFFGASDQRRNFHQNQSHRPPNSNVNVDHVPKKDSRSNKDFEGGQYVDFEEVK